MDPISLGLAAFKIVDTFDNLETNASTRHANQARTESAVRRDERIGSAVVWTGAAVGGAYLAGKLHDAWQSPRGSELRTKVRDWIQGVRAEGGPGAVELSNLSEADGPDDDEAEPDETAA
jgi:hypothetical protein